MYEIYLLEQLDAFARLGTLSRAAEELHITQPALSRSMKKLEAVAGVPLFDRGSKRISLNATGKVAARFARRILEEEREMQQQIEATDRSLNSIAFGSCAPLPITRLAPTLQMAFPDKAIITRIEADDETLLRGLKDRTLQFAVLHERPDHKALFYQRYIREDIYLYVPEGHPLAGKEKVAFAELAAYQVIANRHIGFWLQILQDAVPAHNLLIQDSMDAMDSLAEASTLAMFNSDAMMREGYVTQGRIAIPISDAAASTQYYAVCLESEKERYRVLFNEVRAETMR